MRALEVLAHLAPVLALLCALLLGRYPGERALRPRRRPRPPRRPRPLGGPRRRMDTVLLPRGGALLACALAGRAPPRNGLPANRYETARRAR
ncbi:MAG: hypothetical protein QOH58_2253 [Thermoleophilaceae bacterium]|nr:hypothetical protein [Thermoleophilaceae bacterium]